MASAKVLLYKSKQKKDGRFPIALRIIKDRKPKYIYLEWVEERHWDEKKSKVKPSHPNYKRINNLILKKLTEADDLILEYESLNKAASPHQFIKVLKGNKKGASFFAVANEYLKELKAQSKHNQASTDSGRINRFKEFLSNNDIYFQEIDEPLLRRLKTYLIEKHGTGERQVMNIYITIRTLFNRAIKEGVVEKKYYPFGKDKVKIKFPDTTKVGLNERELLILESFELAAKSPIRHARNVFLFSFYFAGIRNADVLFLKWSDFKDGRLYYQMGKNNKSDSLKVPNKIVKILEEYEVDKQKKDDFIFPELKKANLQDSKDVHAKLRTANRKFNKYLKKIAEMAGIEKNLSMHIARHTFGKIAGDKISPRILQKLYRHTSLITTLGYQKNFIHKETDDALDTVINF
jgi:integrase/recombinase XerD